MSKLDILFAAVLGAVLWTVGGVIAILLANTVWESLT
jgi:hypothetical protein